MSILGQMYRTMDRTIVPKVKHFSYVSMVLLRDIYGEHIIHFRACFHSSLLMCEQNAPGLAAEAVATTSGK